MKRTLIVVCLLLTVLAGATSASESPPFDLEVDSENKAPADAAGGTWTGMVSGTDNFLLGVWGSSAGNVFAVGMGGTILRYNGSSWGAMTSPATGDIEDVCGNTADDVYAVEYYYDWSQGEWYGGILHYNGSAWSKGAADVTSEIHAIWTRAPHIFVVGDMGIIWHYDGSSWSQNTPTGASLEGVWGSSANNVFAVGENGTILRYDGSSWGSMSSGTTKYLWGVWGSSANNVFAVGENGTILRYDGSSWGSMSSGTTRFLFAVWGSSESDVFAVGQAGTILHYNGSAWSSMSSGTEEQLEGVWGSSSNNVFAVGTNGTILHYTESTVTTPTVATTAVTAISDTTATSGGNVTSDGGAPVTHRGVCWGTSVNPTISDSKTTDGEGTGTFTSAITGLSPKTPYHVRAYATNSAGTAYGSDTTFTTLDTTLIPTVTTAPVTAISDTTATSGGNVTGDGGTPVTHRGVCWGTSVNPTIFDSKTTDGEGTGTFISAITDLIHNTTYHVRAYATNSVGTAYGSDISFRTPEAFIFYVSKKGSCGTHTPCYASIQEAVDAAGSGALIKIAGGVYFEDIVLNEPKSLTLQGGWDSSFISQDQETILSEDPIVLQGSLTLQMLSIKFPDVFYVSKSGCGDREPCYGSIQEAVEAATSGVEIRITGGTYTEDIVLNQPTSLILQGGWDSSFISQTQETALTKAPRAPKGSLTLQMLTIKP